MTICPTQYSQNLWEENPAESSFQAIPSTVTGECSVERFLHSMSCIDCGDRFFELNETLPIVFVEDGGRWVCEYEPLGLMGYGDNLCEAFRLLQEDLVATYDELAEEPDEALTEDARELRNQIVGLVTVQFKPPWGDGLTLRPIIE